MAKKKITSNPSFYGNKLKKETKYHLVITQMKKGVPVSTYNAIDRLRKNHKTMISVSISVSGKADDSNFFGRPIDNKEIEGFLVTPPKK